MSCSQHSSGCGRHWGRPPQGVAAGGTVHFVACKNSSPATPGACYNTNGVLEFDVLNPVTPKKGVSALLASALKDSCVSVVSHRNVLHHGEFMRCPGTSEFELLLSASPDTVPLVNMVC